MPRWPATTGSAYCPRVRPAPRTKPKWKSGCLSLNAGFSPCCATAPSLPDKPYQYAEWKLATVNIDYHIEVDKHFYSVPYKLIHDKLDVRLTAHTVEAFQKGERVAAHVRSFVAYHHTTLKEHMPPDHQNYLEWTPSRIIDWAKKTGPATAELVQKIIDR